MHTFQGTPILEGKAVGPALITDRPVNFTAAFTQPKNLFPWGRSTFSDRHHPWFGEDIRGRILFLPACIGSTHTGLVLLDLVRLGLGPAAMVVEEFDPLLASGPVLSEVWYGRGMPCVAHPIAPFASIVAPGTIAEVDGISGVVTIRSR